MPSAASVEAVLAAANETPVAAGDDAEAPAELTQEAAETVADQSPVMEAASEAAAAEFAQAGEPASAPAEPPPPPKAAPRPIVAMRGDDRPGMRKAEAAPAGRGGKFGDRKDSRPGGPRQSTDNKFEPYRPDRDGSRSGRDDRGPRGNDRPAFEERGPRLGDAAFRAQREAFEAANHALKKLAMQAHGEVLTHLITAWEKRDPSLLPGAQELGKQVAPAVRNRWVQAVSAPSGKDASEALLRLEIAAELPTPAEHLSARRMLQLQLLTRRNAPAPAETWGEDAAQVLSADFDAGNARRVQNVLKVLLKR